MHLTIRVLSLGGGIIRGGWLASPDLKGIEQNKKADEHDKPRAGSVANTFAIIGSGAVGFIAWLDGSVT
jgi:hypothetical protein